MRRLIVVVDSREQCPWEFQGVPTVSRALKFGDYSLRGLEGRCAVERKSAADLAGTLSSGFARFVREFGRAGARGARLFLVVEATFLDFEGATAKWSPGRSARSSVARLCAATGCAPLFCGTRSRAAATALAILREHAK